MRFSRKLATFVAILFCVNGQVSCEPDYVLRGHHPTSPSYILTAPGPRHRPTVLRQVLRSQRPGSKIVESYISSEFTVFGGVPPSLRGQPQRRPVQAYRLPHPNDIPRGSKPFEVVKAPVIYHQTVTDTDVTKALGDAFDVIEKLRKPGHKAKALPDDDSQPTVTNVEFVNHILPERGHGNGETTTTTIVEAPQQIDVVRPSHVTILSNPIMEQHLAPVPAAAEEAPPSSAPPSQYQSSLPEVQALETPEASPPPKLIIPSQPHVTTLGEAVAEHQVRTIIQPVYIPYPVDQNGRPLGPLPDYHSMDFSALLSAQKDILAAMAASPSRVASVQIVETEPVVQQQPQYYIQSDQQAPAETEPEQDTSFGAKERKRIARRRNKMATRT